MEVQSTRGYSAWTSTLLIGDLDSVSPEALSGVARVERHPVDKDATDLELALAAAARLEPASILVLGGATGCSITCSEASCFWPAMHTRPYAWMRNSAPPPFT